MTRQCCPLVRQTPTQLSAGNPALAQLKGRWKVGVVVGKTLKS